MIDFRTFLAQNNSQVILPPIKWFFCVCSVWIYMAPKSRKNNLTNAVQIAREKQAGLCNSEISPDNFLNLQKIPTKKGFNPRH